MINVEVPCGTLSDGKGNNNNIDMYNRVPPAGGAKKKKKKTKYILLYTRPVYRSFLGGNIKTTLSSY